METRASYAVVGLFTIAVITAAFGFVYWLSGSERGASRTAYKVEFQGSVAGLTKGAPVLFNGIRVGDVVDVYFDRARPEQAFARIEVQPETPIKRDTKASLDVAILSGVGVVALRGGSAESPPLEKRRGDDVPVIEAERGGIASLLETARGTADRANELLDSVNGIVSTNREALNRTVRNVETFSDALGRNAAGIDRLLASVAGAADKIGPVAAKLEVLTDQANGILQAVEPARVSQIVRNLSDVAQTVGDGRARLAEIVNDTANLMSQLKESAPKLDGLLAMGVSAAGAIGPAASRITALADDAGAVVRAVDPARVGRIMANVDGLMTTVDQNRERVGEVLRNTASLTQRLNDTAPKLDELFTALTVVAENLQPATTKISVLADEATARIKALDPAQLNRIVANANRFADGLSSSTPDLQATLKNANQLSAKLNQSADRIDAVLEGAQKFLGSASGREGQSTFESVRLAAEAFRKASENLDRRATEIAQGVNKLAGSGSRQVDALGNDARRTVNDVGRAVRNIERNPSAILFGGNKAAIPEYGGR